MGKPGERITNHVFYIIQQYERHVSGARVSLTRSEIQERMIKARYRTVTERSIRYALTALLEQNRIVRIKGRSNAYSYKTATSSEKTDEKTSEVCT